MPYDKRTFQKQIKTHLTSLGYTPHKNRLDYTIDCADGTTRLIVRVPDGNHGVFIGAQFADFGDWSGNYAKAPARWYAYETILPGAMVIDYTEADIVAGLTTVTDALAPYIATGKALIVEHMNGYGEEDPDRWIAVGENSSEASVEAVRVLLGMPPTDPYGEVSFAKTLDFLRSGGATTIIPRGEYEAHRDFYDRLIAAGCTSRWSEDDELWLQ